SGRASTTPVSCSSAPISQSPGSPRGPASDPTRTSAGTSAASSAHRRAPTAAPSGRSSDSVPPVSPRSSPSRALWDDGPMSSRAEPTGPAVTIRPSTGAAEYSTLAAIWRGAVDATHDFLTAADRDEIESALQSDYL